LNIHLESVHQRGCPRRTSNGPRPADHTRSGFTVLELITISAIVTLLAAITLPAINSAREAARRTQCVSNLRQIGLALGMYHDQHQRLPAGWVWEATRPSAYGWAATLAPYLEDSFPQVERGAELSHSANAAARQARPAIFVCPSDISQPLFTLFQEAGIGRGATVAGQALLELPAANYVGVYGTIEPDDEVPPPPGDGTFLESRGVAFSELRRGLSNTVVVGERMMAWLPSTWIGVDFRGEDAACRIVGNVATAPNCAACDECEFSSRHSGGANFLFADGHVTLLSNSIESGAYRRLARRSGF
jgi:prepilin-type processing-associated H-X9-DG protein